MRPRVIYVDVDDTLIRSVGTKRIPMPGVVAEVRCLKESGAVLYLWSSGGADYARSSAAELGISDCFSGFLPKPDVLIDDQPPANWHTTKHVYPQQADTVLVPSGEGGRKD